jgi:hypothetical protein
VQTVRLPLGEYAKVLWGIVASCAIGCGVGFGVDLALPHASDLVRLIAIGGGALATMALLFVFWLKLTPGAIARSLRS